MNVDDDHPRNQVAFTYLARLSVMNPSPPPKREDLRRIEMLDNKGAEETPMSMSA